MASVNNIILALAISYALGSIPFGILISKLFNVDIRQHGSGNIGATNVLRTLGPIPGLIVFILDILKGTAAVYLSQSVSQDPLIIIGCGLAAVLGHSYSIFLRFKGGRGAATGLGILLGIAPDVFLGALIIVILIIGITRYVSIASMTTPILVTLAFIVLNRPLPYSIVAGVITILIIIRHIPNINRLLNKTEPKIGEKNDQNKA